MYTVADALPVATDPGYNVTVAQEVPLPDGRPTIVSVTFDAVTAPGTTSIGASLTGPSAPEGFKLGKPAVYYDVSTTASFSGQLHVCFTWQDGQFSDETQLRLFHHEGGMWRDVTVSSDTTNNKICGVATSLSPFVIGEGTYTARVQPPINVNGTSVFQGNRGVVPVKFAASRGGVPTCTLPPAFITILRVSGSVAAAVNESEFSTAADAGSDFRITDCQYIYNVAASSLGVGTYRAEIWIEGALVGSASFGLK